MDLSTYLLGGREQLLLDLSRNSSVLSLHIDSLDTMLPLPLHALGLNLVQDLLGLSGQISELLGQLIQSLVLLLDLAQEYLVVLLCHEDRLQLLNVLLLGVLNAQMVLHLVVEQTHLLENFEDYLCDVVVLVYDIEGFFLLLQSVLSLGSFHLEDIKGNFAHFDGAQFC